MTKHNLFASEDRDPEAQYRSARNNLLVLIVFTAINLLMPLLGIDRLYSYSASFPTTFSWLGDFAASTQYMPTLIALGCAGLYLLCWLMAKKWRGFMRQRWCCSGWTACRWPGSL